MAKSGRKYIVFYGESDSELGFGRFLSKTSEKHYFFENCFFSKNVGDRLGMNFRQKIVEKPSKLYEKRGFVILAPGGPGGWGRENMDGPWES